MCYNNFRRQRNVRNAVITSERGNICKNGAFNKERSIFMVLHLVVAWHYQSRNYISRNSEARKGEQSPDISYHGGVNIQITGNSRAYAANFSVGFTFHKSVHKNHFLSKLLVFVKRYITFSCCNLYIKIVFDVFFGFFLY